MRASSAVHRNIVEDVEEDERAMVRVNDMMRGERDEQDRGIVRLRVLGYFVL